MEKELNRQLNVLDEEIKYLESEIDRISKGE